MRKIFPLCFHGLASALTALALCLMPAKSAAQTAVSLGTSSVGARFHVLAVGMGDVVSRHSKLNVTVEPIGGSDANIRALKAKRIDFALTNSLAATHGFRGIGSFAKEGKAPVRVARRFKDGAAPSPIWKSCSNS